ncbi:MAG: galactokinase [Clostridiales bacterium]|nr:galactokinase [Clostridiales bacterium]
MTTTIFKKDALSKAAIAVQEEIYGKADGFQTERILSLVSAHQKNFGERGELLLFSSPGRIEICGNHTDHNHGKVLTAAVTVDIFACVNKTDDNIVYINSEGYPPMKVNLSDVAVKDTDRGTSTGLIRGVAAYYKQKGYKVGGFCATMNSNVPKGAGVSSSSSFEVFVAEVFNDLYNDGKISAIEKAKASKYAENAYFGKPCGLMDQAAIALGGINVIDFFDPEDPAVIPVKWTLGDSLDIFVINTGGDHSDLVSDYAGILNDMKNVAKFFSKDTLSELEKEDIIKYADKIMQEVSGRAVLRSLHFFDECERVEKAKAALERNNKEEFLKQIRLSGESSWKMLQNLYSPHDEKQLLPYAVALASLAEGAEAVRVHGGGFAGTILAFVDKIGAEAFAERMAELFGINNVFKLAVRNSGAKKLAIIEV